MAPTFSQSYLSITILGYFSLKIQKKFLSYNQISKWEKRKLNQRQTERPEEEELKPSPSTSTRC